MTSKQDSLYWREWAAVHRTDPSIDRHELHIAALGEDVSHKAFSNAQFDTVLGAMRAISKPASLEAQLRQLNQTKTRLLWKITVEQLTLLRLYGKNSYYILALAGDKFPTLREALLTLETGANGTVPILLKDILQSLDPKQLEHLRSTVAQRIQDLRKAAKHTIHDMMTLAGLPCECRQCTSPRSSRRQSAPIETSQPF